MAETLEAGQAVIELRAIGDQLRADLDEQAKAIVGKLGEVEKKGAASFDVVKVGVDAAAAATKVAAGVLATYTGALIGVGKASIDAFADFEEGFANVGTLVDEATFPLEEIEQQLLALPPVLGDVESLTTGLYQTLSAGIEPAKAVGFIETQAQLAKVGIGELSDAVGISAAIINSFSEESVGGFERVAQVVRVQIAQGVTTLAELSATLPTALPAAQALGVEFEDLAATFAFLTTQGLNSARATTSLAALFTELLKPGTELEKVLDDAGLTAEKLEETLSEDGGLVEVIRILDETAEASGTTLAKTFGSAEAFRAVGAIQKDIDKAADAVARFGDELDNGASLAEVYEERTDNLRSRQEEFTNSVERARIALGAQLAPVLESLVGNLSDVTAQVSDFVIANADLIDKNAKQAIEGLNAAFDVLKILLPEILESFANLPDTISDTVDATDEFIGAVAEFFGGEASLKNYIADLKSLRETNEELAAQEVSEQFRDLVTAQSAAQAKVDEYAAAIREAKADIEAQSGSLDENETIFIKLRGEIEKYEILLRSAESTLAIANQRVQEYNSSSQETLEVSDKAAAAAAEYAAELKQLEKEQKGATGSTKKLKTETDKLADSADEAGSKVKFLADLFPETTDPLEQLNEIIRRYNELVEALAIESDDAGESVEELGFTFENVKDVVEGVADSLSSGVGDAAADIVLGLKDAGDAAEAFGDLFVNVFRDALSDLIALPIRKAVDSFVDQAAGALTSGFGDLFSSDDVTNALGEQGENAGGSVVAGLGGFLGTAGAVVGAGFAVANLLGLGDDGPTEVELRKQFADTIAESVTGALQSQEISDAVNEAAAGFGLTFSDGLAQSLAGFQANFEAIFLQSILPGLSNLSDELRDRLNNAFEEGASGAGELLNLQIAGQLAVLELSEAFPDLSQDFLNQLFEGLRDPSAGAVIAGPKEFFQLLFGFTAEEGGAELARDLGDLATIFGIAVADAEGLFGEDRAAQIAASATALGGFAAAAGLTAGEFEAFTENVLENLGVNTELFELYRDLDDGLRSLLGVTVENRAENEAYTGVLQDVAAQLGLAGIVIDESTVRLGDLTDIFIESNLSAEEFATILTALPPKNQELIASLDPPLLETLQNVRNETLLGADAFVVLAQTIGETVGTVTSTFQALDVGQDAAMLREQIAGVQEQLATLGEAEDPDVEAIAALETQLGILEGELEFVEAIIEKLNREGSKAIRDLADAALEDGSASAEELAAIFEQITQLQEGLGDDLSRASMGVIDDVLQDLIIANVQSEEELRNLASTAEGDTTPAIEGIGDEADDTAQKFVDLGVDATTAIGDIDAAVGELENQLAALPETIEIDVLLNFEGFPDGFDPFKIPEMHQGGIVPGQPGEESLRVLEAGELVIPAGAVQSIGSSGLTEGPQDQPRFAAVAVSENDLFDGAILRIADLSRHNLVHVDGETGQFKLSNLFGRG